MGGPAAAQPVLKSPPPLLRRLWAVAALLLVPLVLLAMPSAKLFPQRQLCQHPAARLLQHVVDDVNAPGLDSAAVTALAAAIPDPQRRLRILMLSHDLTLTGAPQVLAEFATHLHNQGHDVRFVVMRGGRMDQQLARIGIPYSRITDVQIHPLNHSEPLDPASFDVMVANTVVTHDWLRHQVEAWGLSFLNKVVWWIHEQPLSADDKFAATGAPIKRHLMPRCGAVAIVSAITKQWWERWLLEGAHQAGLDYSPLAGSQQSFSSEPPLPPRLPNLRVVRNPLPSWVLPLLEHGNDSGSSSATSGPRLPECSRASQQWPLAGLRRQFRALINATDADYVVLVVSANSVHKGVSRLLAAFVRAWQRAGTAPNGAPGRMLLVGVGPSMPLLTAEVKQAAAGLRPDATGAAVTTAAADLLAAVHLFDATDNATQRLGWYVAGDVHVLNSKCESFGRVTVEGMAASLPQLATTCGGTLELVQENVTGLLHPAPTADDEAANAVLEEHILRLDRRTPAGRAMGERLGTTSCRRVHSEFMPQQFLDASEALLRQVAYSAAAANLAALAGQTAGPSAGLPPGAAAMVPSGWAAAFMPSPANQARMVARDMRWAWEELPAVEAAAAHSFGFQSGSRLFVLSSSVQNNGSDGPVPQALLSLDLGSQKWRNESFALPASLPKSHFGAALVGGRHLFVAAGQTGGDCSPATTAAYRLDLKGRKVEALPELPEPRYSPALAVLGDGRLHVFGGLLPDRVTPAQDHWSLGVNADGSTDDAWVVEQPLPSHLGGSHCTVMELQPRGAEPVLYYWGCISQEAQPRDAATGNFSCAANRAWGSAALWSFSQRRGWRRHRDLPLPLLHAASCTVKLGQDAALVVGGQHYDGWLSRTMWLYNATEDSWARVGHAPVYSRSHVCGLHAGRLVMALGQQGQHGGRSYEPGPSCRQQFWAPLPPELLEAGSA